MVPPARSASSRKPSSLISSTVYDIPAWARGVMVIAGMAGVVVVIVASLNGGEEYTIGVDKMLHFGGYATLAAIFVLGLKPALFVPALLLLAGISWAIEFLQPFNARSFDVSDGVANMTGLALGAGLGLLLRVTLRVVRTQYERARLKQRKKTYGKGAVILRQGAPVQQFCLIERGEVQVFRELEGTRRPLGNMGPGDVFGLLGVIQEQPQFATVEALSETTLYSLDMDDLIASSGGLSEPVALVMKAMAKYLREMASRVAEAPAP